MEEFEDIDYKSISRDRKQLDRLTSDRYWSEYRGDWKAYLTDVFKHEDTPQPFQQTIIKSKIVKHPFDEWI